jgi:hypothetical protein
VFKKKRQVGRFDIAQKDLCFHSSKRPRF